MRRLFRAALTVYPVCGALGFVVGYNIVSAPNRGTRVGHGFVGFLVGYMAMAVLLHLIVLIVGASGIAARLQARQEGGRSEP